MRFRDEQVRTHRKLRGTTVALMAPACSALGQTPGPWKATGRARDYGLGVALSCVFCAAGRHRAGRGTRQQGARLP